MSFFFEPRFPVELQALVIGCGAVLLDSGNKHHQDFDCKMHDLWRASVNDSGRCHAPGQFKPR